jgi:hypothetical protein
VRVDEQPFAITAAAVIALAEVQQNAGSSARELIIQLAVVELHLLGNGA